MPPKGAIVYVMLDGGRIRLRANGGEWREPCLGLILWETPEGKWIKHGISHPTDKDQVLRIVDKWMQRFAPPDDGEPSWEVVVIADGAQWIWDWAKQYRWAIGILDYYHVREHVWEAARALHGEGTPQAAIWVKDVMNILWSGQVYKAEMLLDHLCLSEKLKKAQLEAVSGLATYLRNHSEFIRFKKHRKEGRLIGSGAVESLCKQVFTMRMKGPGMFWSEEGAANLMALRTLYVTDQWNSLWQQPRRIRA